MAAVLTPAEQKKVQAFVKDATVLSEVQNDIDLGTRLNVNSTPCLLSRTECSGTRYHGRVSYPLFHSMVDGMK